MSFNMRIITRCCYESLIINNTRARFDIISYKNTINENDLYYQNKRRIAKESLVSNNTCARNETRLCKRTYSHIDFQKANNTILVIGHLEFN